jgi:hypothetical protein
LQFTFTTVFISLSNVNISDCKDIKSIPINNTGERVASGKAYGSNATVTCKEGYVVSNNYNQTAFNMSCSSDGEWKNKLDCVPVG